MQFGDIGVVGVERHLQRPSTSREAVGCDSGEPESVGRVSFYRGIVVGIGFAMPLWALLIWCVHSI